MRRAVPVIVSLVATVSVLLGAAAARAGGPLDTVSLTNSERQAHGLGPLAVSADLQAEAQRHADDMAAAGALWHTPDLANRVTGWKRLGENVGRGPTAEAIHAGFMASPTHRANVLQPAYTQIGVGHTTTPDGRLYLSVLYRLPLGARVAPRVTPVPTAPTRAAPPSPVAVQVAGETVTRSVPAVNDHTGRGQQAAAQLHGARVNPATGRQGVFVLALVLLLAATGAHVSRLAGAWNRRADR